MRYCLCHSCVYFHEEYKTPTFHLPKHCSNPHVASYFGASNGGFINGIDIFFCDYFTMHSSLCGDVVLKTKKGGVISYVIPKKRKEEKKYYLSDNSKNIREIYDNEKQKRKSVRMEDDYQSINSHPYGLAWCPF